MPSIWMPITFVKDCRAGDEIKRRAGRSSHSRLLQAIGCAAPLVEWWGAWGVQAVGDPPAPPAKFAATDPFRLQCSMAEERRPPSQRSAPPRNVNVLLVQDAFATWVPPTVGVILLATATLLDTLGVVSEQMASLFAVFGLLILGAFAVAGPLVSHRHPPKLAASAVMGLATLWIVLFSVPFTLRLFPGAPVATTAIDSHPAGTPLQLGNGRFDLVLDAHLPLSSERQTRQLHYALTLTDGAGKSHRYHGELGDSWQTRRLGRRGTAPVHLEHLSTSHEIDNPAGGTLRLDEVTLSGVPNATLAASFYRHRAPAAVWLLAGGILLALGVLAFDLWWDPERTPTATLLTATAAGAVWVFCSTTAGHPGLRQVFGSTIVGGIGGVPTAGIAAWLARRSPWTRAITSHRAT